MAPTTVPAGSPASGAASGVGDIPEWIPPLVAMLGIVVVVLLVVGARRTRTPQPPRGW